MKSFGLLRTNVGLTTNIKVMVDSTYKLSLDSIESDPNLSFDKFKKVTFTKDNYYDELIPYFYKDLPADTAFSIKYDNDVDTMSNNFKNQYDELYNYGARNIVDNKNYKEEYEYFAPMYITKNGLPKKFIIFRVDGSGIGVTDKNNFSSKVLQNLKTIKIFDLTKESILGEWLYKNFTDNKYFPDSPLDIDFRSLEFCRWNGIDYQNGGYTHKSMFIDDILDEEKEIFELEKFVFDSYKNNKVVFPNIINFSFLFDDTPSTSEIKRKWSINRYYGFYLDDIEIVKTISPYLPVPLRDDIIILGDNNGVSNIIYSSSNENPFLQEWTTNKPFYVEYKGNYYRVEQFKESITNQLIKVNNPLSDTESRMSRDLGFSSSKYNKNSSIIKKSVTTNTKSAVEQFGDVLVTKYKIIGDIDFTGLTASSFNQNYGEIDSNNTLVTADGSAVVNLEIEEFTDADVWLIEIDGVYHNLVNVDNSIRVNTDYSFTFNQNDFSYTKTGNSIKVSTIVDYNNAPKKFSIYKVNFSEIKDFDNRIIDTDYSKYEYEESENITNTDESKMYLENIRSISDPIDLDDFSYKNNIVNIPTSSEYTANYETFKIEGNDLSPIWRKNSVYCKWGFHKSLGANDLPYSLNNSLIFEDFNRTANIYESFPIRSERNLDYFYTINSSTSSYIHHSLHVENLDSNNNVDSNFEFNLGKYLNFDYDYDYFQYMFGKSSKFLNGKIKVNTNKFSYFNVGDSSIPNHTLFRGIRFDIYEVNSITTDSDNKIDKINIKSSNIFDDYKFSILLSKNKLNFIFDSANINMVTGVTTSIYNPKWALIDDWKMDKTYETDGVIPTYVLHDDILYYKNSSSLTTSPIFATYGISVPSAPYTQDWTCFTSSIFWAPNTTYTDTFATSSIVYNSGEYYYCASASNVIDFWNPIKSINTGYDIDSIVIYKKKYYKSIVDYNYLNPISSNWIQIDSVSSKWQMITSWSPVKSYTTSEITVHNETVYRANTNSVGQEPSGTDFYWRTTARTFIANPNNNSFYQVNDILRLNNRYNLLLDKAKLDNGIVIYINKKWKNILVNIEISDNTVNNLSGKNRDDLYIDINQKLTASNFTNAINDITNTYGFTNYLSYVIIDDNGVIKEYSYSLGNIKDLPYLIKCEEPDKLNIKVNSLFKRPIELPNNLNPFKKLDSGRIIDITQLDYYNDVPVAVNIIENQFPPKIFENYHGNKNVISHEIYRYSGYYSPIFYDIQLFERDHDGIPSNGNYKFDTTLDDFGLLKERKIRKVNRKGNILRLGNVNDEKSLYPMLDEFGYSVYDFFIFASTWDLKYYLETVSISQNKDYLQKYTIDENVVNTFESITTPIIVPSYIGKI